MNIRIHPVVLTLSVLLCSSNSYAWQTYQAPKLEPNCTGTNGLLTNAPGYNIAYAEGDRRPMAQVIRTSHYRLFFPREYEKTRTLADVQKELDVGLQRCRDLLGPTKKPVDIYVCTSISPKKQACESGVETAGIAFSGNGTHVMVLDLHHVDRSLIAHEGVHVRLRDLGLRPPGWFEEGMAEFAEAEDGFNKWHYDNLASKGTLSIEEMNSLKPCSHEGLQARSTAWAMVYFMVEMRGERFSSLPMTATYPSPTAAHSNVVTYRKETDARSAEMIAAKGSNQ